MEPRGRYAETLILLAGAVLGEVWAPPKGAKIDEKAGPRKRPLKNSSFLRTCAQKREKGAGDSRAEFPCCVPFRHPGAQSGPKVSQRVPRGGQGRPK